VDLRELPEGAKQVEFDRVLLVSDEGKVKVGTPLVKGAKVTAEILSPLAKGPKVHIYRMRRRKASRRKTGHRQKYVQVRVTKIET
jgi:large subunit ribosomal protein L21